MNLGARSILYLASAVLTLFCTYQVGGAGALYLKQQMLALPVAPPMNTALHVPDPPQDNGENLNTFDPVLQANIFQAERKPVDVPIPTVKKASEVKRTPQKRSISLELIGTVLYPTSAYAYLSKKGRRDWQPVRRGQCFDMNDLKVSKDCSSELAQVNQVTQNKALVVYQMQEYWLELEKKELTSFEDLSQPESNPSEPPRQIVSRIPSEVDQSSNEASDTPPNPSAVDEPPLPETGQDTFHFNREWVDQQLANWGRFLQEARVVPTKKDEKLFFKFKYIKKGSLYETLGLIKGDILLEINGNAIDNPSKGLALMNTLRSEREIVLRIERDEKPITLTYYID